MQKLLKKSPKLNSSSFKYMLSKAKLPVLLSNLCEHNTFKSVLLKISFNSVIKFQEI